MTLSTRAETAFLSREEGEWLAQSHYPAILDLDEKALSELQKRIRAAQDKDRGQARQMRRSIRGKAEARGSSFPGNVEKPVQRKQIFAGAVRRLNKEIGRRQQMNAKAEHVAAAQRALKLKTAADGDARPSAGKTADTGLNPIESRRRRWSINRHKVGSISQRTKNAQAAKDGR